MMIVEFLTTRLDEAEEDIELAGRDVIDWYYTNPTWVQADVAAKRAVVQRHERAFENCRAHPDDFASKGALLALLGVLKQLALPYAEHPDYDPEWKP